MRLHKELPGNAVGKSAGIGNNTIGRFVFQNPITVICKSSSSDCVVIEKGRGNRPDEALATLIFKKVLRSTDIQIIGQITSNFLKFSNLL